jgi:hypothetical protein
METEVSDLGLTGSAVEYLTQVFWHSVTFSSVVYPHSDDLAIQVSLALGGSQPTKRRSPPEAVQRPANADAIPELARTIAASVSRGRRYGKAGTSERDRFFDSVGAVMQSTYDLYRAQLDTVPFNHDGRGAIEPPVVFTTNFDLEIERALATSARTATCYYVAIPVVVEGESKARASSAGTLRWVVGRFKTAKAIRTSMLVKSDGEEGDWMWFSQMDEPELLNGPLLVKLNGSPLHEVPTEARKIGEDNGDTNRVHRATLIDEVDFVEAMRADTSQYVKFKNGARRDFGFPDWLSESLDSESRFWLFCGNRLADWTLRLHLLTQFDRIGADSNLVWDVAKDVNDERVQLLWWFGVKSVDGDCGLLTPGLLQFSTELQKEAKRLERGRK